MSPESLLKSGDYLSNAIEKDPGWAPLYEIYYLISLRKTSQMYRFSLPKAFFLRIIKISAVVISYGFSGEAGL